MCTILWHPKTYYVKLIFCRRRIMIEESQYRFVRSANDIYCPFLSVKFTCQQICYYKATVMTKYLTRFLCLPVDWQRSINLFNCCRQLRVVPFKQISTGLYILISSVFKKNVVMNYDIFKICNASKSNMSWVRVRVCYLWLWVQVRVGYIFFHGHEYKIFR